MNRRRLLALGGAVAVAGCLGTGGAGVGEETGGSDGDEGQTLGSHPAARALAAQPTRGPDPDAAPGVVVAFEDPSCPTCRRFEREVIPQLRSEHVESGTVSLVFRGYPVIYPWGQPAARALEAVYDRDAGAHWTLVDRYFQRPDAFRGGDDASVYDETEAFLAAETTLDAPAAIDAARNGAYDSAVRTDLDAGRAAGAGQTTPHLFFFRDGEYQTRSAGYTGMTTIEAALGL